MQFLDAYYFVICTIPESVGDLLKKVCPRSVDLKRLSGNLKNIHTVLAY